MTDQPTSMHALIEHMKHEGEELKYDRPPNPVGRTPIYIAGPMTGLPEFNYPAFEKVTVWLRSQGFTVISPHEIFGGDQTGKWEDYMRESIRALTTCKVMFLLKGWRESRGAKLEKQVAEALGMMILEEV